MVAIYSHGAAAARPLLFPLPAPQKLIALRMADRPCSQSRSYRVNDLETFITVGCLCGLVSNWWVAGAEWGRDGNGDGRTLSR